jgi:hypothetical protein
MKQTKRNEMRETAQAMVNRARSDDDLRVSLALVVLRRPDQEPSVLLRASVDDSGAGLAEAQKYAAEVAANELAPDESIQLVSLSLGHHGLPIFRLYAESEPTQIDLFLARHPAPAHVVMLTLEPSGRPMMFGLLHADVIQSMRRALKVAIGIREQGVLREGEGIGVYVLALPSLATIEQHTSEVSVSDIDMGGARMFVGSLHTEGRTGEEATRIRIVDAHAAAMLAEMRKEGVDALGVAGGVVIAASDPRSGSQCHVFVQMRPDITTSNGPADPMAFMTDVAYTMIGDKPS